MGQFLRSIQLLLFASQNLFWNFHYYFYRWYYHRLTEKHRQQLYPSSSSHTDTSPQPTHLLLLLLRDWALVPSLWGASSLAPHSPQLCLLSCLVLTRQAFKLSVHSSPLWPLDSLRPESVGFVCDFPPFSCCGQRYFYSVYPWGLPYSICLAGQCRESINERKVSTWSQEQLLAHLTE